MKTPRQSDICVSIRSITKKTSEADPHGFKTLDHAVALLKEIRPDRIEWSYTWRQADDAQSLRQHCPVFVAAINTISPPGHAVDFEGEPCIAPWMAKFGSPAARSPYMCMNNPGDVDSRAQQVAEAVSAGLADAVQHDDWYGNAQILRWGNWFGPKHGKACFCDHCLDGFREYMGLDVDYKRYLHGRGIAFTAQLAELADNGQVPLWDDYVRFQTLTVRRYLSKIRSSIARAAGEPPVFTVNALADGMGSELLKGNIEYLNGETWDFSPKGLYRLARAAEEIGVPQVSSFFPDVKADQYHGPGFVTRVRRSIAVAYAVGLIPLFPYDVYAGDNPRWFGNWDEYSREYEFVRSHRDWFDGFRAKKFRERGGTVEIVTQSTAEPKRTLHHRITEDATWDVSER